MPRIAERTYLFADLRDYTVYVEMQDDEAATRLIGRFRRIVRNAIAKRGGAEIKTEGDSFYVVFELASDAVRAAIAIQRAAMGARGAGQPIRVGIGINTGEAVLHGGGYVGSNVNIAARIAAQAPAGAVYVSETVRGLVRTSGVAAMTDIGPWQLKGVREFVHLHSVEIGGSAPASAPALRLPSLLLSSPSEGGSPTTSPELVGRDEVMASLLRELEAGARGEARFVALVGEAGVGKSRLARELAGQAHREGFHVLAGRAHARRALPYEAFIAAVRPFARSRGVEILKRLLGSLIVELAAVLPEIDAPAARPSLTADEQRDRFYRVIQLLLEDAAAQRPVLLVLEDFHDSDAGTRDLLDYLATTLRAGICVLITCRTPAVQTIFDLERDRRLRSFPVAPLSRPDVDALARLMLGKDVTAELSAQLHERTNGVPFFVEEVLKTTIGPERAMFDHGALPHSIRDAIQQRVDRLAARSGPAAADLLRVTALAGVPLTRDVIGRLSDASESEVDGGLAAGVEAQLLERDATRREVYRFRHDLAREAVEDTIAAADRRRLHRRIAAALVSGGESDSAPTLLARHLAAAGENGPALRYALQAADEAARMGAYRAAIEQLEFAKGLASSPAERLMVVERRATALLAAGDAADAEIAIDRLDAAAGASDESSRARLGVLKARALRAQGSDRREEAETVARAAVAALEPMGGEILGDALVMSSELAWVGNDLERAADLARRALALGRETSSAGLTITALTALGAALLRSAPNDAIGHLEEARGLAISADLPTDAVNCWYELSRVHLLQGRFTTAADAAMSGLRQAREHGLELAQARLLAQLTTIHVNHGDYDKARKTAEQAVALARAGTLEGDAARVALAHVLTNQGEEAAALEMLDQLAERASLWDFDRKVTFLAYRTQALLSADRLDEAAAAAADAVSTTTSVPGMGMTAFLNAAAVAEARRDALTAARLSDEFERYFKDRDTPLIRAVRLEIAAIRELCEGRDASDDYQRAAEAYESLGGAVHALYRRATAAILTLGAKRSDVATQRELVGLREELERRGAYRYARLIDRALARPSRRHARSPLTAREMQIALLLASGATDERIGSALGVTPAQVDRLVARVVAALGVTTRSQVVTWALDRGATPIRPS